MMTASGHGIPPAGIVVSGDPAVSILAIGLVIALGLGAAFLIAARRHYRRAGLLAAIIDSYNTPVLFYDDRGRLIYINGQAESVFADVVSDFTDFDFILKASTPDGPHRYLTDRFGNGYRLEILKGKYKKEGQGQIVFIKGYARVR